MATHFEQSLQRDIDRIRTKVSEMAALGEHALRDCLKALNEKNRVLAFSVILRDQHIDELEKEVDRLCLEFIVRQQPVAGPLRMAYATIRINLELERVGDYAESIARQILKVSAVHDKLPLASFKDLANVSIPMLRNSVKAFIAQDAKLAAEVAGIDALISGHTHNRLDRPAWVGRTPIIQSGCHGSFVGRLDLTVDGGKVVDVRHQLRCVDDRIEPDAEMAKRVAEVTARMRSPVPSCGSISLSTPMNSGSRPPITSCTAGAPPR